MTTATVKRRLVFAVLALTLVASTVVLMADQAEGGQICGPYTPHVVDGHVTVTLDGGCEVDLLAYAYNPAATTLGKWGDDLGPSLPQTLHDSATGAEGTLTAELPCGLWQVDVLLTGDNPAVLDAGFVAGPGWPGFVSRFRGGMHGNNVCAPAEPPLLIPPMVIERSEAAVPVVSATLAYTG